MVGIRLVLLELLSVGGGEIFFARVQGLLYQNPVTIFLPVVKPLLNYLPDCVGCGDMMGLLQDHLVKDDEPLRVIQSVPHPT